MSDDILDDILDLYENAPSEAHTEEKEETPTFDFDEDFQTRVAALTLRDAVFLKRNAHLLKPDYFDNYSDKLITKIALHHFEKFSASLHDPATLKEVMGDAIKTRVIREEEKSEVIARLKELRAAPIDNPDYTGEKVATFAKNQAIENAMMQCVELHEKGDFKKMEELMQAAFKVGQRANGTAYDFFGETDNRSERREDILTGKIKRRGLPLGVPQFDNLLHHRGFGYSELTIFMAPAKRGKTTSIWDVARRWTLMGKNVLGITLEVSKEMISDRLDANISGVPMQDLEKRFRDVKNSLQLAEMRAGKFLIHEYPSNSLRPQDVEDLIEEYRSKGIHFDAVVVDYLDIMAPNRWMPNDIANSKAIWSDMRGIAQKYEIVMLSATQANREGAKKTTVDDTDVSEDYNKIRIADLVLTLNATDEELAKGEMRIFFAASRNQRGKFTVLIKNNMECMQFMTSVLDVG